MRNARIILLLAALAALVSSTPADAAPPLARRARAAIVVDASSGEALYALHPDARLPIASTTKLMTATLALELARPGQRIASPGYAPGPDEVTIGLASGERMTVHDLLLALLLPSANDAAITLAHGLAGSIPEFVREMNAQAATLGLAGTHYANPVGLDDPANHSTARDLAHLAAHMLASPTLAHIVDLPSARLHSGLRPRVVVNRNDLVRRYSFVDGVKTGHTTAARYVLVAAASAHGAKVVSVVLGEPDEATQDADSLALLRFGLSRFARVHVLTAGATVAHANVRYYGGERVPLVAADGVGAVLLRGRGATLTVSAPARLTGPMPRGRAVGSVTVAYGGRPLRTVALVTGEPVRGAGLLRRLGPTGDAGLAALACLLLGGAVGARRVVRARRAGRGERSCG